MAKLRSRKIQSIPMKIGYDPSLWRFASLQAALEANTYLLSQLIQTGMEQSVMDDTLGEARLPVPILEKA